MAANAIDLCTAATVAGDLGITSDATVQRLVTAASRVIATYCGRAFERASSIVEYPAGYGRPLLLLNRAPIVSVASVTERGATVDSTEYVVLPEGLYRRYCSWPVTARFAGNISQVPAYHQGTSDDIVVTYTAGYVTPGQNAVDAITYATVSLPEDVQEAAILTAVQFYRRRGTDPNVASESLGDWSVSYAGLNRATGSGEYPIPDAAVPLLEQYRMMRVS